MQGKGARVVALVKKPVRESGLEAILSSWAGEHKGSTHSEALIKRS